MAAANPIRYTDPSVRERLPPEIVTFLQAPFPHTLTVRGPPGSGKTSFALAVLSQFGGYRAFLSARVPQETLLRDHPWAAAAMANPIDFVERLRFRTGAEPSTMHVDRLREALQARASDLIDLAPILSLPDELAAAFQRHAPERKLVVIDSWEAWVENLIGPTPLALDVPTTRWELERAMLDLFRHAGVHVLLVVERDERARLDFVTDGAISLTVTETDGRAERWIAFQKLRGTRLGSVSYPFTLEGGQFQSIPPTSFHLPLAPIPDEPDPGPTMPGIWPGSTALAVHFGRLPIPGTTLLEADGETPERLLWRLVAPIVASSLRSGGRAIVLPPTHIPPTEISESIHALQESRDLTGALRILTSEPMGPTLTESTSPEASAFQEVIGSGPFLRTTTPTNAHSLAALFVEPSFLPPDSAGSDLFRAVSLLLRRTEGAVGTVLVGRSSDPAIEPLRARSSLHLQVHASRGQFFLSGIRPWTPHVVLTRPPAAEADIRPYDLIPIV